MELPDEFKVPLVFTGNGEWAVSDIDTMKLAGLFRYHPETPKPKNVLRPDIEESQ